MPSDGLNFVVSGHVQNKVIWVQHQGYHTINSQGAAQAEAINSFAIWTNIHYMGPSFGMEIVMCIQRHSTIVLPNLKKI